MKREVTMKRFVTALVLGIAVAGTPIIAMGATTAPTPVKAKVPTLVCKATKAKSHTPMVVTAPTKLMTPRIGTFTLVTNCGNIVIRTDGVKAPLTGPDHSRQGRLLQCNAMPPPNNKRSVRSSMRRSHGTRHWQSRFYFPRRESSNSRK